MNPPLQHITLRNFKTESGNTADIHLSYEVFGRELHSAPIVLVNHALTGNSAVSGEKGWWKTLVGEDKIINTGRFTVICFNIPGNGYDGVFIENYKDFKNQLYVKLAKNYLRYRWLVTYLFGASPVAGKDFYSKDQIPLEHPVRSIRSSHYGYVNSEDVDVSFDSLEEYTTDILKNLI